MGAAARKKAGGREAALVRAKPSHIVGIGGSAGSLHPLEALLGGLGACSSISVLVVTHRERSSTAMAAILDRATKLDVRDAEDGSRLEAGVVYVIPADAQIALRAGQLTLRPRKRRLQQPIDELFRALADDFGDRAFGVVLSGMGDDGTAGLSHLKERHGICAVQTPASSEFDSMPRTAIEAGLNDIVGSPPELAAQIAAIVTQPRAPQTSVSTSTTRAIDDILAVVLSRTGHDFRHYKKSTITRRVERRMNLEQAASVSAYVTLLERDSSEVTRLVADLLIGVTSFFRDPEVFAALKDAIRSQLRQRGEGGTFRAWVAGCATGEEAYSVAMLIRECWDEVYPNTRVNAQVYATDLDASAIDRARAGVYPLSAAATVGASRLAQFFDAENGSYRVKRSLRDLIVFAKHNLISDPPFTRVDLLSCRNVLIYMDLDLQQRLWPIFAYALAPRGILALGTSETMGGGESSFAPLDGGIHKLFERRDGSHRTRVEQSHFLAPSPEPTVLHDARPRKSALPENALRAIVEHATPPVIIVDAKGELLFASQRMGKYFEPPVGRSNVNVFAMARDGLALPLRAAIGKALARQVKVVEHDAVIKKRARAEHVDIVVWPLEEDFAGSVLVAFIERDPLAKTVQGKKNAATHPASELGRTKAQLERLMREMGSSHDLLRGMNEDLQSANEELQSANEELTTSKEEMQSLNEELLSLNGELQSTNEQLVTTNDDMRNLLNSSQIPTLFLDRELRLKRFTAPAARIARLIPTDLGRPVTDLSWNIEYPTLAEDVAAVIETLVFKEAEVSSNDGSIFTMRIHPYRTVDDIIDGVVITFVDTTAQKRAVEHETAATRDALLGQLVATWPGVAYVENASNGSVDVVSLEAERLLGYPRAVLTGATLAFWKTLRIQKKAGHVCLRHRDGTETLFREHVTILAPGDEHGPRLLLHSFRRTRKKDA